MSEPSTWIKLDRNITKWGWYTDTNTKAVFIHLLLKANTTDSTFLGKKVKRGELVTSQKNLAHDLGLTIFNIRTALRHLQATGEVTVKTTNKFSVITVLNYNKYQDAPQASTHSTKRSTSKSAHTQPTNNPQQYKNIKNVENGKNIDASPPALREWEKSIPERFRGRFETERDWKIFTGEEVGEDE